MISSPPSLPLVQLDRVHVAHGRHIIFSGVSFAIRAGEHTALLGPNGAGKSTLLQLLHGDLRPFQGVAEPGRVLFGFEGAPESSPLAAKKHVRLVSPAQQANYVRQGWNITGEDIILSGLDNAAMVYGELSSDHYAAAAQLAEAADAAHLLERTAPAMSQGQLRLMLLLRALMAKPVLLLLDEPFDGLDTATRLSIQRMVSAAVELGSTIALTAHRREDVPPEIVTALIVENGTVAPYPLERTIFEQSSPCEEDSLKIAKPTPMAAIASLSQEFLLKLLDVDVFIDRVQVLFHINWIVWPGEQWLVTGSNGSGKSTLLRLLYGEEFAAYGGEFLWRGRPRPALEALRAEVGYVSDRLQHAYHYDLSAEDVIISGLTGSIGLYHEPSDEQRALSRRWITLMQLEHAAKQPFHSLSSGTARRVLLARALASSPPVLLLDEPCSGLDAASRALFLNSLPILASQGVHIIHVSHNKQEHSPFFTHELHLKQGRVVYAGKRR